MIGELSEDLIMTGDEIDVENLFSDDGGEEETQVTPPAPKEKEDKEIEKTTEEEEINPDDLFDNPESVGSGKDNQEEEDTQSEKDKGTSPKTNFYSSIASALKEEGIFPDLDDDTLNGIKTPEDFAEAVEKTVQARLDERQKRIDAALQADVEPDEVRRYEQTLANLDAIKEEYITDETEKGERLRKNLIYQDFRNRGYSEARAKREVEKSFNAGTDIEDAKEALESNREYFSTQYQDLIKEAQEEAKEEQRKIKEEAAQLKKSMLEDKEVFTGITLDKTTRQKAFENITKPVFKTEDGEYLTAIQKYEMDNPVEFRKYLSVLFTMTDGFKNIDGLVKGKVKKEVKQSLRELEHKLSSTARNSSGNPRYVGGVEEDTESYIGKGWDLDV
ncbi:putative structural protein [Kehishuvirus tikkala]|uniref:Structural protein n=1 Tax=Kehishuvirus sp. 'tikkala' TaxID=3028513 RepID=A0AAF0IES8_9CAUD|nr:putative structural protein [Kehishuvirus sp. 'tikkala']